MTRPNLGTIRIDEEIIPIVSVELRESALVVVAEACRPMNAEGNLLIYGSDGSLVVRSTRRAATGVVRPGEIVRFTCGLAINDKQAGGG